MPFGPLPRFRRGMNWEDQDPQQWNNLVNTIRRLENATGANGIVIEWTNNALRIRYEPPLEIPEHGDEIRSVVIVEQPSNIPTIKVREVALKDEFGSNDTDPLKFVSEEIEVVPEFGATTLDFKDYYVISGVDTTANDSPVLKMQIKPRGTFDHPMLWLPGNTQTTFGVISSLVDPAGEDLRVRLYDPSPDPNNQTPGTPHGLDPFGKYAKVWPGQVAADYQGYVYDGPVFTYPPRNVCILPVHKIKGDWYVQTYFKLRVQRAGGNTNVGSCTPVIDIL